MGALEKRVLMVVGPTCVGKTGVSIVLAQRLGTEIISADSMQIYRHMDIGTEKPTTEQRAAAPHHMLDIIKPTEGFSAGLYIEAVRPIMERLHSGGRVPVVVGGTGLYVKAMTRGLFDGPDADAGLRAELAKMGELEMYMKLKALDPAAASAIEPSDIRRIIRALEVCMKSGRRISDLRAERTLPFACEFIKIALTRDRKELYSMIDARVDEMFNRGLLEEVRVLLAMRPHETPMQAIGYKEVAAHLAGEYDLDEAVRLVKRNTRRYAKRQFTWFNAEPGLRWVDVTGMADAGAMASRVMEAAPELFKG